MKGTSTTLNQRSSRSLVYFLTGLFSGALVSFGFLWPPGTGPSQEALERLLHERLIDQSALELCHQVRVLGHLKEGDLGRAMLLLETYLDSALINIDQAAKDGFSTHFAQRALELGCGYRVENPGVTAETESNDGRAVREAVERIVREVTSVNRDDAQ